MNVETIALSGVAALDQAAIGAVMRMFEFAHRDAEIVPEDVDDHVSSGGTTLSARFEAISAMDRGVSSKALCDLFLSTARDLRQGMREHDVFGFAVLHGVYLALQEMQFPTAEQGVLERLRGCVHTVESEHEHPAVLAMVRAVECMTWLAEPDKEAFSERLAVSDCAHHIVRHVAASNLSADGFLSALRALKCACHVS